MTCLIGYTGFVGSNLLRQGSFDKLINSSNFMEMKGCHYDRIVCAGISAVKWKANRDPEGDWEKISALMSVLETVTADSFVLISTIDVYPSSRGADERSDCHTVGHHAYGTHRLAFEDFCRNRFPRTLVVRLPALFGPGLKKNVIFDLLHDNCLEMINPESSFQYYNLENLSADIKRAEDAGLDLVNLFTEPIATREIIDRFFAGKVVGGEKMSPVAVYDLKTRHANLRGLSGDYMYSHDEVLLDIGRFVDGERA